MLKVWLTKLVSGKASKTQMNAGECSRVRPTTKSRRVEQMAISRMVVAPKSAELMNQVEPVTGAKQTVSRRRRPTTDFHRQALELPVEAKSAPVSLDAVMSDLISEQAVFGVAAKF